MKGIALAILLFLPLPGTRLAAGQIFFPDQWEPEIRRYEESDRQNPPKPGPILFVGSSSFRMWDSLAKDFPAHYVLNRSFGGSQIADVTYFAGRIVIPYRPSMIVLYAGDNDLALGRSSDQVLADFDAFVRRARKDLPGVTIAFVSIKPSPARVTLLDRMREANTRIERYATEHERVKYIDVFTRMLGKDGKVRDELFGDDGLHMNRSGYRLWTVAIGSYLHH